MGYHLNALYTGADPSAELQNVNECTESKVITVPRKDNHFFFNDFLYFDMFKVLVVLVRYELKLSNLCRQLLVNH